MSKRGRPSAASQEVAVIDGAVALIERPEPPLHLTPDEEIEWTAVVSSLPANWFPRETHPLLEQYCRHSVTARRLGEMMDQAFARPELELSEVKEITAMQSKMTASMKALAASMRISQQSTYQPQAANTSKRKNATTVKRPWD